MTKTAPKTHIDIYKSDHKKINKLAQKEETHADFVKRLIGSYLIAHPHHATRLKQ